MDPSADKPGAGANAPLPASKAGIGTHFLRYSGGSILVMLAGLISFPALTRLLDNTQYGILGYYETWLMIAVAVAKLGAQHAIIRFYPYAGADSDRMARFATNLFLLPLLVSVALWSAAMLVLVCVDYFGGARFSPVLWLALASIPLLVFVSLVQMVLRAGEHSGVLTITRVSWRWLELVTMLGAVLLLERSALAAYGGKIVAALLVISFYVYWIRKHLVFNRESLDVSQFSAAVRYGMPLVINEIATVLLISIDRLMLKGMLDDFAVVGIYTIGYSLALQVSMLMHAALSESFVPVANGKYESDGAPGVRQLKAKVLLPMTYASIGIGAAIACVGSDALQAISGADKAASGPVFAWIGCMYALYPLLDIAGYGLLLHKRSMTVLAITLAAAASNILLNLWLIPTVGMMGAVYATVASYAALAVTAYLLCPRDLRAWLDRRALTLALVSAGAFVLVVAGSGLFGLHNHWARLFVAGGLWLLLYVLPVLLLDPRVRGMVPLLNRFATGNRGN
ncbi:lipopolysaccharide biosynthesis protein [Pseudoxanthomonas dokdonensis]|uniref:lipopolysaccharide biosynthesis protein n=1 Tax=Pseudoxanthomonas dokdonensis TaxID=344882 RepID=UPI000B046099|nr:oligosaccharide flippase family protein [Pseudoxanthomonas dokdonensis]